MNYYKVQSTYFLILIVAIAFGIAILPLLRVFSQVDDDIDIAKMNQVQAEMYLYGRQKGTTFDKACSSGFLHDLVSEVSRDVYCRMHPSGLKMIAYIILEDGTYYVVDSEGTSCTLLEVPHPAAVDCQGAQDKALPIIL